MHRAKEPSSFLVLKKDERFFYDFLLLNLNVCVVICALNDLLMNFNALNCFFTKDRSKTEMCDKWINQSFFVLLKAF